MGSVTEKYRKREILHYVYSVIWSVIVFGMGFLGSVSAISEFAHGGEVSAVTIIVLIILLALAGIGGWVFVRAVISLASPQRAKLGKSILRQAGGNASLSDLCAAIDADIERGGTDFGSMHAGTQWIIGDEAVLIDRVRGCFCWQENYKQGGFTKRRDYLISILDNTDNLYSFKINKKTNFEAAINYLPGIVPWAADGGFDEYIAFLDKTEEEKKAFDKPDTAAAVFSASSKTVEDPVRT